MKLMQSSINNKIPTNIHYFKVNYSDKFISPMDSHENHEINIVINGKIRYKFENDSEIVVPAGAIITIPGNMPHKLIIDEHATFWGCHIKSQIFKEAFNINEKTPINIWRTHLKPEVFGPFEEDMLIDVIKEKLLTSDDALAPVSTNDHDLFQTTLELFEQLHDERGRNNALHSAYLTCVGYLIAIVFIRVQLTATSDTENDTSVDTINRVKSWIDRHYLEDISIPDLAEMAGLSLSHFTVLFHKIIGYPPKNYLVQKRLNYAANMLIETNNPIANITFDCGFGNQSHFSRSFKAIFKCSPGQFRKLNRG